MNIALGISFLIFAIIYIVTILIVKYLLKQINDDCVEETNQIVFINSEYKSEIKYLKGFVRNLSGMQYCGNKDICLRKIENELLRFEKEMNKKEELSNNFLAEDR